MPVTTTTRPAAIFSPGFAVNPEPTLAWLRQHEPLHEIAPGVVVVTRYDDCRAALTAPGLSAAGGQAERQRRSGAATSMLNTDGGEHQRLRRPGQQLLGPRAIEEQLASLEVAIAGLFQGLGADVDLTSAVAEPVATHALIEVLGLSLGPDTDRLATVFGDSAVALDPMPSPEGALAGRRAVADLEGLLDAHLLAHPSGRLARLIDENTTREDVIGIASLAVVGGWAPLAELLTTTLELALFDPRHRAAALGPDSQTWCEDVIRWHTPIPFVARRAESAVHLPGGMVPSGTQLIIHIGSSNRDPERFDDAVHVTADRPNAQQHLALGAGPHFCLGAPLVRTVLPIALRQFFAAFPDASTRGTLFTWRPGLFPRRPLSTAVHLR